jgi:hypothetical protein
MNALYGVELPSPLLGTIPWLIFTLNQMLGTVSGIIIEKGLTGRI